MPRWHVALRVMVYQRDGSKLRRRARQSRRAQTWPPPSFFAAQATFALSLSRNTRVTQQSRRGKQWKSRRLCLSAPDDSDIVGAVGRTRPPKVSQEKGRPVQRGNYTPALGGLVQIGLMAAKRGRFSRWDP